MILTAQLTIDFVRNRYQLMGNFFPNMNTCLDLLKGNRETYQQIREGSATAAVLSVVAAEDAEETEGIEDA